MTHDLDAAALVVLYHERVRLTAEFAAAERPTGADAEAVMAAGALLDEACESFRRKHYPRRGEVVVGLGYVMVCSATRRRVETVYDGSGTAALR